MKTWGFSVFGDFSEERMQEFLDVHTVPARSVHPLRERARS